MLQILHKDQHIEHVTELLINQVLDYGQMLHSYLQQINQTHHTNQYQLVLTKLISKCLSLSLQTTRVQLLLVITSSLTKVLMAVNSMKLLHTTVLTRLTQSKQVTLLDHIQLKLVASIESRQQQRTQLVSVMIQKS